MDSPPPAAWQLDQQHPVARVSWPLGELRLSQSREHHLVVELEPVSQDIEVPAHHVQVDIFCPNGRDLIRTTAIASFPAGDGGRFFLTLPSPWHHCQSSQQDAWRQDDRLLVDLTLVFTDGSSPFRLQGRVYID